jgi:hypothetical protein
VNWTADIAFVHTTHAGHVAIPFVERFFHQRWTESRGGRRSHRHSDSRQLELLA